MILVVNKIDRPDARIGEVVDEVYQLFFDEDADRVADRLSRSSTPTPGRALATLDPDAAGESIQPLLDLIV